MSDHFNKLLGKQIELHANQPQTQILQASCLTGDLRPEEQSLIAALPDTVGEQIPGLDCGQIQLAQTQAATDLLPMLSHQAGRIPEMTLVQLDLPTHSILAHVLLENHCMPANARVCGN